MSTDDCLYFFRCIFRLKWLECFIELRPWRFTFRIGYHQHITRTCHSLVSEPVHRRICQCGHPVWVSVNNSEGKLLPRRTEGETSQNANCQLLPRRTERETSQNANCQLLPRRTERETSQSANCQLLPRRTERETSQNANCQLLPRRIDRETSQSAKSSGKRSLSTQKAFKARGEGGAMDDVTECVSPVSSPNTSCSSLSLSEEQSGESDDLPPDYHKNCHEKCRQNYYDCILYCSQDDNELAYDIQQRLIKVSLPFKGQIIQPKVALAQNIVSFPYFSSFEKIAEHTNTVILIYTKTFESDQQTEQGAYAVWSNVPHKCDLQIIPLLVGFDDSEKPQSSFSRNSQYIRYKPDNKYFKDNIKVLLSRHLHTRLEHDEFRRACEDTRERNSVCSSSTGVTIGVSGADGNAGVPLPPFEGNNVSNKAAIPGNTKTIFHLCIESNCKPSSNKGVSLSYNEANSKTLGSGGSTIEHWSNDGMLCSSDTPQICEDGPDQTKVKVIISSCDKISNRSASTTPSLLLSHNEGGRQQPESQLKAPSARELEVNISKHMHPDNGGGKNSTEKYFNISSTETTSLQFAVENDEDGQEAAFSGSEPSAKEFNEDGQNLEAAHHGSLPFAIQCQDDKCVREAALNGSILSPIKIHNNQHEPLAACGGSGLSSIQSQKEKRHILETVDNGCTQTVIEHHEDTYTLETGHSLYAKESHRENFFAGFNVDEHALQPQAVAEILCLPYSSQSQWEDDSQLKDVETNEESTNQRVDVSSSSTMTALNINPSSTVTELNINHPPAVKELKINTSSLVTDLNANTSSAITELNTNPSNVMTEFNTRTAVALTKEQFPQADRGSCQSTTDLQTNYVHAGIAPELNKNGQTTQAKKQSNIASPRELKPVQTLVHSVFQNGDDKQEVAFQSTKTDFAPKSPAIRPARLATQIDEGKNISNSVLKTQRGVQSAPAAFEEQLIASSPVQCPGQQQSPPIQCPRVGPATTGHQSPPVQYRVLSPDTNAEIQSNANLPTGTGLERILYVPDDPASYGIESTSCVTRCQETDSYFRQQYTSGSQEQNANMETDSDDVEANVFRMGNANEDLDEQAQMQHSQNNQSRETIHTCVRAYSAMGANQFSEHSLRPVSCAQSESTYAEERQIVEISNKFAHRLQQQFLHSENSDGSSDRQTSWPESPLPAPPNPLLLCRTHAQFDSSTITYQQSTVQRAFVKDWTRDSTVLPTCAEDSAPVRQRKSRFSHLTVAQTSPCGKDRKDCVDSELRVSPSAAPQMYNPDVDSKRTACNLHGVNMQHLMYLMLCVFLLILFSASLYFLYNYMAL